MPADIAGVRCACFMMQRNEGDLLAAWLAYHAALFGPQGLHVVDNGSDDPATLGVLEAWEARGVTVLRGFAARADFERKGPILARLAQEAAARGPLDFVLFLDCDEFLAVESAEGTVSLAPEAILAELAGLPRDGAVKVVSASYLNDPDHPDRFFRTRERKCLFEAGTVAALDLGFHAGVSANGREGPAGQLVHLHFRMRPHAEMQAAARAKLAGRVSGFDAETLAAFRAARGPGHHLVPFLQQDAAEYRAWLDRQAEVRIPAAAAFAALGVPYPHGPGAPAEAGGGGTAGPAPSPTAPPTPPPGRGRAARLGPPVLHAGSRLAAPEAFERYVRGGHAAIPGWITPGALSAAILFNGLQARLGVAGHVCEIGVHHGRFFLALSLLRQPGERALAIDVFDLQEFNVDKSGQGDLAAFKANVASWLGPDPAVEVLKADSLSVTGADVRRRLGGRVRLFSVDGSHTCRHTLNDLRIAEDCLAEGGIVFLDDFLNPAWPGVMEAVVRYLDGPDRPGRLAPVGYGENKFFLTTKGAAKAYGDLFAKIFRDLLRSHKKVELCDQGLAAVALLPPEDVLAANRLVPGGRLSFVRDEAGLPAGRLLGTGTRAERAGTWACGVWSCVVLDLPPDPGGPQRLRLSIDIACFRNPSDPEPSIDIHAVPGGAVRVAFPPGQDRRVATIELERPDPGRARRIELWFHNPRAASPASLGLSPDPRRLALRLRHIGLEAAAPRVAT